MKKLLLMAAVGMFFGCGQNQKAGQEVKTDSIESSKLIALSFDDGPNVTTTVKMLDMLEKHDVKGSFFVIGKNINEESAVVMKRAFDMGCDIQNHSQTHSAMPQLTAQQIKDEIEYTSAMVEKYIGVRPTFFRPPFIAVNDVMYENIELPFICGVGCNDWEPQVTAAQRAEMVIKNAADGQIILLHDFEGNDSTVAALDVIIPTLKEQGYQFVTVPELFKVKNVTPERNKLYSNVLTD